MKISKSTGTQGAWVKGGEVVSGTRGKLVSEAEPQESEYGTQLVAKIRLENDPETKNVRINKISKNALVDAFGDESKNWVNKYLTVHVESMTVGGKRVKSVMLIPEDFELTEDNGGYLVIQATGNKQTSSAENSSADIASEPEQGEEVPF